MVLNIIVIVMILHFPNCIKRVSFCQRTLLDALAVAYLMCGACAQEYLALT
jgi:hypothetical protein